MSYFNNLLDAHSYISNEMLQFNDVDSERYMYLESELAEIEAQIDDYCVGGEMDLDSYCEQQQTPSQYQT